MAFLCTVEKIEPELDLFYGIINNVNINIITKKMASLNQFINSAVSEKISAFKTEDYIWKRAEKWSRKSYLSALSNVPNTDVDELDK